MLCEKCRCELEIAASFVTAETDPDGVTRVYSTVDLRCPNTNCPDGRRNIPTVRLRRPIKGGDADNAISCCGIPLVYLTEGGYWLPDEAAVAGREGEKLTLRCPLCGGERTVDVSGLEKLG